MAWGAVAKAGVKIAAEAAVRAGADELAKRTINKYFPDAQGEQLNEIERKIGGIFQMLNDNPYNNVSKPNQCEDKYSMTIRYTPTWQGGGSGSAFYILDGPIIGFVDRQGGGVGVQHNNPVETFWFYSAPDAFLHNVNPYFEDIYRSDGGGNPTNLPDNCGDEPRPDMPNNGLPPSEPGDFGGSPAQTVWGTPYFDEDGNLRMPFKTTADNGAWTIEGSYNPATGETNIGETVDEDGDGIPDYDKKYPPGDGTGGAGGGASPCVKDAICGDGEQWPITVPELLTQANETTYNIENLPQAIAWFARNFDAISGQYPIQIEIQDTDPLSPGDQKETISLPNQAEAMAEIFGLAYEANTNSELAINILFRLIPEVMATKNSTLTAQDYTLAITNWLGFRTKNVERSIDSNFDPLRADSLASFLKESTYKIQGVEDDDPHTMIEWLQQLKFAASIVKASLYRNAGLEDTLVNEVSTVTDNQPAEDTSEAWEKFIDALNRQQSNLTDRNLYPRPRVDSVDDVLNPGTVLPDRGSDN